MVTFITKNEFRAVWDAMKPDIFTTRLFFDPIAVPLTILFHRAGCISANLVTFSALVPGLIAAIAFSQGSFKLGALMYYLFFLLDSIDGKLARLKGGGGVVGVFNDFLVDRIVIGSILTAFSYYFISSENFILSILTLLYFFSFFLKDLLELKLQQTIGFGGIDKEPNNIFVLNKLKIHFKPGQLLSGFIVFIVNPLTEQFLVGLTVALFLSCISFLYSVIRPWITYLREESKMEALK